MRDLSWITVWRPNVRMAERFRDRRVFLAGDAAHMHPPTGGQALNTGVQDAYNLGWKLAAVLAGAPEGLLDSYEIERIPVAARVLGISSDLLQRHVDGAADAIERGEETRQLDVSYRSGPQTDTLAAGDRAPDAPSGSTRLFELFRGTHWTLLRFGAAAPDVDRAGVRSFQPAGQYVDQSYADLAGPVVLVRPDGYIGLITSDATTLETYLHQVLPPTPTTRTA